MSQSVITNAFEQLKAQQAANGSVLVLDEFVFANIPDLDTSLPISRDESWPEESQIVHRQSVGKAGMVNANAVAYSTVLGADVGDFEFNWIGLISSSSDTVCMIVHAPLQKKIKTAAGQQGNVLTRSFLMEYSGASEQTAIITPVDTWQIDFTARLNGVDERIRLENIDTYGDAAFLGNGFQVAASGTDYTISRGVGYVAGIRAALLADQVITITDKPVKIWVDVCWRGTLTSEWAGFSKIVVAANLADYVTDDEKHYVSAIAEIAADGTVSDLRRVSVNNALSDLKPDADTLIYFDSEENARLSKITEQGRNLVGQDSPVKVLEHLAISESGTEGVSSDKVFFRRHDLASAVIRSQGAKNGERLTPMDCGAIGDGKLHKLSERFSSLALAQVVYPFATSLNQSIDWAAIQSAVYSGTRVDFACDGRSVDYVVNEETAVITAGQVLAFDNAGGYGYADYNFGGSWETSGVRVVADEEFTRRIRTRRLWRGSAADPQDAPISCVFNIQAEGVRMYSPCIWLQCDYTDMSPDNLGADCDVGIFVGTRPGVHILYPAIIGYFRKMGIYFDVTQSQELPRFDDITGKPYPEGSNKNLGDGSRVDHPYIRGARVGLGVYGALPQPGKTTYADPYYDQILGATVPDLRGRGGFSDFLCVGGRIFGPDHHSGYRRADPKLVNGVLTQAGMESEPDFSPAAIDIDGLSNNASSNLWGMRIIGTRIATWEMFRVRLRKASRIVIDKSHIEGRNGDNVRTAAGELLTGDGTNDYTRYTYGAVAGSSQSSRCAYFDAVSSTPADTIPHWYGTQFRLDGRDGARIFLPDGGYLSNVSGNTDIRAPLNKSILMRNDTTTVCLVGADGIALGKDNAYRLASSQSAFTEAWARTFRTTLSTGTGGPGPGIYSGEGSPEGVVTAVTGSKYYRTGSTANSVLAREWIKDSGNGNTGWLAR